MINSDLLLRAKFDIAYFASLILSKPLSDEHLLAIRLYTNPIADEFKRTSVMAPRQFGMSTLVLISAIHRAVFHNEESIIVVRNSRTINNMTYMIEGVVNKVREVLNMQNLPKKVQVISADAARTYLYGKSPSQLFIDGFADIDSRELDSIYRFIAGCPKAQLHLVNSGYTDEFDKLPGEYVKLHITRPKDDQYTKYAANQGVKFATEEWLGVKHTKE